MAGSKERVRVGGRELVVTNLDKVLYPETGTTKADVLAYYAAVAHVLIPAGKNRPVTRKRWVHGVGTAEEPGEVFFQKNLEESAPGWIPRASITHKDRTIQYPLVNDPATLTWLAQIASLEIHVPQWRIDSHGDPLPPDRMVLDLDPGEGAGLAECVEVAKLARVILKDVGLDPVPVTSGSKGIHLYAGLDGTQSSEQISAFARELARALEADHPELAVSDMKKTLRTGKVLVDWSQNNAAKTTIVPYSLRGRLHPTVAAPRTWRELTAPSIRQLDYEEVMRRVKDGKDPFESISDAAAHPHPSSTHGTFPAVESSAGVTESKRDGGTTDPRLEKYRSMRDPDETPEPFAADRHRASANGGETPREIFVIQEHHASRLHFDFRLERDGVLVSWALPKGVPTSADKNHLAVQTEDHPMDYAAFEGTIPKGQYGAGSVSIWDSGTYECEKWIAGKEVIVTLTGTEGGNLGGTRKFALINTEKGKDNQGQWLIHLMDSGRKTYHPRRFFPDDDVEPGDDGSPPAAPPPDASLPARVPKADPPPDVDSLTPMLASAGTVSELSDSHWRFELKWDGVRALVIGEGSRIRLISRNGNDMTASYPELTVRDCWPAGDFVADGEIIAVGPSGRPDFGLLQSRMKLTKPADVRRAQKATPVRLMLFDLLVHEGADLRRRPWHERRERLDRFYEPSDCPVYLSDVIDDDVRHILDSARELGLEGVMAKRSDSRYVTGQRSKSWLKLKVERTQEVVVGGWRPGNGSRKDSIGSLLLGIPEGSSLRYVGRVGSGFSTHELEELRERLETISRKTSPFSDIPAADASDAHWVMPGLVGEVTYGEWTSAGKLRHPVWRGWRLDKEPEDVVMEAVAF